MVALACAMAVPAGAAFAASGPWAIQKSPNSTLPGGTFASVACSSADACTAVGTYQSPSGLVATLAERWNGTAWARQAIPNLPGVTSSAVPKLFSVSCPSARFCAAVGGTGPLSSTPDRAASLVWNGRSWAVRSVPLPAGGTEAELSQVSCVTRTFCEAVGSRASGTGTVTLAEVWRGSGWRAQRSPSPFAFKADTFSGVSCVSAVFCEATGYNSLTDAVFAERWNGTSWRSQALPRSTGFDEVVSCASATFCEAVGFGAARWNGTSWRGQAVPRPAGATFIDLTGVSCASAKFCDAVGQSSNGVAAVAWHGRSWRSQPVPAGIGVPPGTKLSGVSCVATSTCEAAGQIARPGTVLPRTLAARWNGHSWRVQRALAPAEATENILSAVSCVSTGFCAAVGSTLDVAGNETALTEAWNGSSWTIKPNPNPARAFFGVRQTLDSVSCVSARFCEAVGESSANPGVGQVPGAGAEMWNGTSWKRLPIPGDSPLISVSCVSVKFCVAVGGIAEVDHWNGQAWSATPSVANLVLNSVSCVSTRFCDAIGSDASGTAAEIWTGTAWVRQHNPPPPPGDSSIILNSVSCAMRNYCVVVGDTPTDLTTGVATTVVELWKGNTWSVLTVPANPKATGSYLNGVSCTSTTACTAVGEYTFGTPPVPGSPLPSLTLAAVWDGNTWVLRTTPNQNPTGNGLRGVSCGQRQTCTAVGIAAGLYVPPSTLIEAGN